MGRFKAALAAGVVVLVFGPVATAQAQPWTTFSAALSAEAEIPECLASEESGGHGRAIVQIDEETGEIRYRVVATHVPGTIAGSPGSHIHVGPATGTGGIVQALTLTGRENGLIAAGTATNPTLAAAILANPAGYYVNVHSTTCPSGVMRGQLAGGGAADAAAADAPGRRR